jgi:hypothetical protein
MNATTTFATPPIARLERGLPVSLLTALRLMIGRLARTRRAAVPSRREEAARVRQLAAQMQSHDPRFASDLFAAADRHERED